MLYYLILFKSLTYAQRANRALRDGGVTSTIARVPESISTEGCGYSVKVAEKHYNNAVRLLRDAGFSIGRVFLQGRGGRLSEVY